MVGLHTDTTDHSTAETGAARYKGVSSSEKAHYELEQTEREMDQVRDEIHHLEIYLEGAREEISLVRLLGLYWLKRGLRRRLSELAFRRRMIRNCCLQLRRDEQRHGADLDTPSNV